MKPDMPKGYIYKVWLIMRLTTVILIATMMQVSAAGFAQKISLSKSNATLATVLREIKSQSGYNFIYKDNLLKLAKPVNINVNGVEVEDVLKQIFEEQPFSYEINSKVVIVKQKEKGFFESLIARFQAIDVTGRIVNETGLPLSGATVKIKGTERVTRTGDNGAFTLSDVDEGAVLEISYLGYKVREIKVAKDLGNISMEVSSGELTEVNVVSTGYQTLPKERATGSFVLIDSALLGRIVSTNILDRLEGVTSGLIVNRNKAGGVAPDISIRGRSTITSSSDPLIILDNFPYDGDISNINPQDVKSISILKDGAAASIWGSRAGNGVIVITTNKGYFNQKPIVSFNTNLTIGQKPDVYYRDQISSKEFIDVEQFLFDKGAYNNIITNGYGSLSPAVEIMLLRRKNVITTDQERDARLAELATHDNRVDLDKYIYRKSINQQYQLNVNGGGQNNKYYISMGYDKNLANIIRNSGDRLTLNANNTLSLFNNKVELYTGVLFSSSKSNQDGIEYIPRYPYEKIADENGNPIAITDGILRIPYVDTVAKGRLLDWHFRPLDEIQNGYSSSGSTLTDYRINLGVNYKIVSGLGLSLNYSYDKGFSESSNYNTLDSYFTRNQINTVSQITTAGVTYPIPLGDIVTNGSDSYYSHYGRGQFNYNNTFGKKHEISAIAGFEVKDYQRSSSALRLYGYNDDTQSNLNSSINPTIQYKNFYNTNSTKIPLNINNNGSIDRYRSYYFNGSYSYSTKYIVSVSARKDESNLFGVKTNQKGVPLWSTGLAWILSSEDFYKFDVLSYLKVRGTFGYNGNVNKSVTAYLTAISNNFTNYWGTRYIEVQNPPNPSLRWEKVKNINFGVDFATKDNFISGSIEYWIKNGIDLIGTSPIATQTGVSIFTGNSANMHGEGVDVVLNSRNFTVRNFGWLSTVLFNYNTDKITSYKGKSTNNGAIVGTNYSQPLEGYSYYSLFSYPWMGLDNLGNPQSLLSGVISKDYTKISNLYDPSNLVYNGTMTPKIHGSFINTFSYEAFEFSFNLLYKFNYVYRRKSLANRTLYTTPNTLATFQQSDYELRWKGPGDELVTDVPSLIYPANSSRDQIYANSAILVEKADHIRLQDIRINYNLIKKSSNTLPLSNLNIYAYASNLGIIWKASKYKIDPDYPNGIPAPKMLSIGLKADF